MPGDLVPLEHEHRCYRAAYCAERTRTASGVSHPAIINATRGLCVTDTAQVRHAISDLPTVYDDLEADLAGDGNGGGEYVTHTAALQIPIDLGKEALQAAIDHDLLCWAESVAERLRIHWDTKTARDCRPAVRIRRAARLLTGALPVLLSLRDVVHMVWVDGSPHELAAYLSGLLASTLTGYGTGTLTPRNLGALAGPQLVPTERDGIDGALALLELHSHGRHSVGTRTRLLTMSSPCPSCERMCLRHRDGSDTVTCAYCHNVWTWDEYQEITGGIFTAA